MSKILIISPHPDDTEIALGGAVYQWCADGHQVTVAVCTGPGDLTMVNSGETIPFDTRRQEQLDAAEAMGGAEVLFLDIAPASKFDTVPISAFVSAFDRLFHNYDVVIYPMTSFNVDHAVVHDAARAACRPGRTNHLNVYMYEQPFGNDPLRCGAVYIPLGDAAMAAKIAAIHSHVSQMKGRGNSIYSHAGATAAAAMRGLEVGAKFAERMYLVRARVQDGLV